MKNAVTRALNTAAMKDVSIHRMLQSKAKLAIYKSLDGHPLFPQFKRLQAKLDGYDDQYSGSRAIADLMTVIREHLDSIVVDLNTSAMRIIRELKRNRDLTSEVLDEGLNNLKSIVQLLKWQDSGSQAESVLVTRFCDSLKTHSDHQIGRAHV